MRLILLGLIFLLALTLGNAFLLRSTASFVTAHDFAPIQITQAHAVKYEWDAFVWRELGAVAVTLLVFGTIAGLRTTRRRRATQRAFVDQIANRR